jgi:hypothetical protein
VNIISYITKTTLKRSANSGIVNSPKSSSKNGNLKMNVTIKPIAVIAILKPTNFTIQESTFGNLS